MCIEMSDMPEEGSSEWYQKNYYPNTERFRLACDLYWVPDGFETYYTPRLPLIRDRLHAWGFVVWLCGVLSEAPDARTFKSRKSSNSPGGGNWGKVV